MEAIVYSLLQSLGINILKNKFNLPVIDRTHTQNYRNFANFSDIFLK